MKEISILEKKINTKFKNKDLIQQAFVHRSYLNENPKFSLDHNERLEFLGDAVLEFVVTKYLYARYNNPEGDLTNWRAALVQGKMLSQIAAELGMEDFLLLSKGEAKDTGKARQYILANTFEAFVGALFLDRGCDVAAKFIDKYLLVKLPEILANKSYRDAKSLLQEFAQDKQGITPIYEVLKEWGPDHAKNFEIGVFLGEENLVAKGQGPSKQQAQQEAASKALKKLGWE